MLEPRRLLLILARLCGKQGLANSSHKLKILPRLVIYQAFDALFCGVRSRSAKIGLFNAFHGILPVKHDF